MLKIDISTEFGAVEQISLFHCLDSDLRFFYPPITGSARFYSELQKYEWYYLDMKEEYRLAVQLIKEEDRVLEVGCGKGAFAKLLSVREYRGLELNPDAIAMARNDGFSVLGELVQLHAMNYKGQYDVVCAFQVLEHIQHLREFIDSCIQCLKPGGLLIFSVPCADSFASIIPNFYLDMPPHHVSRWSDHSLTGLANIFDLELVTVHHEQLQLLHRDSYNQAVAYSKLLKSLRMKSSLMDMSLLNRSLIYFCGLLLKVFPKVENNINEEPIGLTVTAIYRKKNQ
jgi:2-polyprenyl-3-methyl-5-hydroxy-6-metoxy-1,4-benzoquinol methylase